MSAISTTTNGSNAISSTENFRSEQLPLLAEIKKPVNSALLELKSADAIDDGSISEPMTLMQVKTSESQFKVFLSPLTIREFCMSNSEGTPKSSENVGNRIFDGGKIRN